MIIGGIELAGGERAIAEHLIEKGRAGSDLEMEAVERRFGPYAAYLMAEVIFYDHMISTEYQLDIFRDALQFLSAMRVRNLVRSAIPEDHRYEDGFEMIAP